MISSLQQPACTTQFSTFPQLRRYVQALYIWLGVELRLQRNTVLCIGL